MQKNTTKDIKNLTTANSTLYFNLYIMSILEKINTVQKKLSVKKDWTNPFYKSKYITLDEIMTKLQPLLDEQWLMVYNYNTEWWVKTIVTDYSENVYSEFRISWVTDPQAMWKVITYWRRYNLVSIFNILADEDDDAQSFYETKTKYTKRIFWMKDFENVKAKKDKYTYEEMMKMIEDNYSIDTEMEEKVMELYWKTVADLFK